MKHGSTDSGYGSYRPSSRPQNGLPSTLRQAPRSRENSVSALFQAFHTILFTAFGKITSISLRWLTIVVAPVIGANDPIVANDRVEKDAADRASHPKR